MKYRIIASLIAFLVFAGIVVLKSKEDSQPATAPTASESNFNL